MPTLGSDKFDLGWIPSEDAVRGRPNGLVRMDNLSLDEDGNVSLTRGTLKASDSQFASAPVSVFSSSFTGEKHRYVGLNDGTIMKDKGETKTFTTIVTGGIVDTAYGATLGQVLICSGHQKKKDDGTYIRNLGIETPDAPTIDVNEKYLLSVFPDKDELTITEGTETELTEHFLDVTADEDTFRTVVELQGATDLTAIQNGITDTESELDQFTLWVKPRDSSRVIRVRLECLLQTPPGTGEHVENYYYYEWDFRKSLELINKGIDQDIGLQVERKDFTRVSTSEKTEALDWEDTRVIRVVIENSAVQDNAIQDLFIEGGRGVLSGNYRYKQVNIFDNGKYEARSIASDESLYTRADHQFTKVTPDPPSAFLNLGHENEVNKIYIYRKNLDFGDRYYLVAIRADTSEFIDNIPDSEAIEGIEGSTLINHTPNLFLAEVPDFTIEMVANYFRRTIYLTTDGIFVSDLDNPDAIDTRFILDTSGDETEVNLWALKVADSSLLVGTSNDIYDITGTLQMYDDGTPDVRIRSQGVNNPPINEARATYKGGVFYMSSDGWRIFGAGSNSLITGATRLLYRGETRYDIQPVFIGEKNTVNYDCVIHNEKLFTTVTLADGVNRRCYVYDLEKRYWYPYFINPVALFVEEDDTLLATFTAANDFWLRILDTGDFLDEEPEQGGDLQSFYLQTCYNDGGLPNNRKDTKVLKLYADSDDSIVEVLISYDGDLENWISLGDFQFNGPFIHNIKLSTTDANLGKSFAIRITGESHEFKFYYWTVEYESRPEQVNYIRIPPTNFGIAGRKRFYDLPFSLDALGNDFTITPYLDGVSLDNESFGGSETKDFYTIAFREETIGHELGIDIQVDGNGVIEFYELLNPRHTEQLPDLARFYHIPYSNLGTPARKRFVRIALVIDTRGEDVLFTPLVDNGSLPTEVINTNRKETYIYYVLTEVIGTDLGGILDGGETPFEFYNWDLDETITEALPAPAKYIYACTDFGTAARKRFSRNSFVCNPRGGLIQFTPILDGVREPAKNFTGNRQQTFSYHYIEDKIFVDFCYEVKSINDIPFEFYQILKPERLEVLPEPVKFFRIPRTNLDTDARKRFFAFAMFLNTRGHDVKFTPYVDGVAQSDTTTFNTTTESTVIHYFTAETVGHDIGGNLETVSGDLALPFEFYGINVDETISEKLPGPAKYLVIPPENLGVAARKRIRTIPLIINTRGGTVKYTPTVDGVSFPSSTHSTSEKRTVLHYFETDSFGIDYGGILETTDDTEFEFYSFASPENVQTLPVGKKFDQVGPVEFSRRYWIRRFRVRIVPTGTSLTWRIFDKDEQLDAGVISTTADKEQDLDLSMIKGIQGSVIRIELQSDAVFHRYYVDLWHGQSGGQTELQVQRLQ